ncbi:unnamed protein product, partial [Didymodactylos carnosus]
MIVEKYPTCDNHHNDLIKLEQAIPSSTTILNTKSVSTIDLSNNLLKTSMEHKIKQLPIFSGKDNENVTKWLNNITQIGKMVNCSDDELYVVAKFKLEGDAQNWYQKNQDKICDWKTFNQLLSHRFPVILPSNDREILRQLAARKQAWNEPISRFYRDIMNLCDKYDSSMADSSRVGYLQTRKSYYQLANKTNMHFIGAVQLKVRIKYITIWVTALVADSLSTDFILGKDWIRPYQGDVLESSQEIRIRTRSGPVSIPFDEDTENVAFDIKLLHPIILGPRQECEVEAQVPISTADTVIFHPKQQLQHN